MFKIQWENVIGKCDLSFTFGKMSKKKRETKRSKRTNRTNSVTAIVWNGIKSTEYRNATRELLNR